VSIFTANNVHDLMQDGALDVETGVVQTSEAVVVEHEMML
jgi:hypothetical protein